MQLQLKILYIAILIIESYLDSTEIQYDYVLILIKQIISDTHCLLKGNSLHYMMWKNNTHHRFTSWKVYHLLHITIIDKFFILII